jgi:hypothetical protein
MPSRREVKALDLVKGNPDLLRRVLELAVETAWGCVDSCSITQPDGDVRWMDLDIDFCDVSDEVQLLIDLGLAEIHPEHPAWVREIAKL